MVCLGGDGVILHANYLFQSNIPPVRRSKVQRVRQDTLIPR